MNTSCENCFLIAKTYSNPDEFDYEMMEKQANQPEEENKEPLHIEIDQPQASD